MRAMKAKIIPVGLLFFLSENGGNTRRAKVSWKSQPLQSGRNK
jgi:hypothetical protein